MKKKVIGILIIAIVIFGGIFYFIPQKESKIDEKLANAMLTNEKVNIIIETKRRGIDYQNMQYSYNVEDFYACKHLNKITCTILSNQIDALAKEDWVKKIYKNEELILIYDIEDVYTDISVQWTDEERKQFLMTSKELKELLNAENIKLGSHKVKIACLRDLSIRYSGSRLPSQNSHNKYRPYGTLDCMHPSLEHFKNVSRHIFAPKWLYDRVIVNSSESKDDIDGAETFGLSLLVGSGEGLEKDKWCYEEALGYNPTEKDFQGIFYGQEDKILWYDIWNGGFVFDIEKAIDFCIENDVDVLINTCWVWKYPNSSFEKAQEHGIVVISFPYIVGFETKYGYMFWQPAELKDTLVAGSVTKNLTFERETMINRRKADCTIPTYILCGALANESIWQGYRDIVPPYYGWYFSAENGCPENWKAEESNYAAIYPTWHASEYILAGYVAYLRSYDPDITVDEIRKVMKENCVKLEGVPEFEQGYGLLQFKKSGIEGITDTSIPIGLIILIISIFGIVIIGVFIQFLRRKYYV